MHTPEWPRAIPALRHQHGDGVARHYLDTHARKLYCTGIALYLLWLFTLTVSETPVFRLLVSFADTGNVETMLLTSGALVTLNTLRAIPLYVSCFCLGEGLGAYGRLVPVIAIPLSYYGHGLISGDPGHHFGMSSIMGIGIILCLQLLIWNVRGVTNRMLALCMFLFSFQWLNLSPVLSSYGFGLGEMSLVIKNLADFFDLSNVLNLLSMGGFSIAFAGALLATALLVNLNRVSRQFRQMAEQRAQLAALREESLHARIALEIQTLVHDLRRPLTTIMGMVDVISSISVSPEIREYARCAGASTATMNTMIEELMSEDGRSLIQADELLDYTMGQVSPMPWHTFIHKETGEPVAFRGNKVRISRALVNLMENAARAAAESATPEVVLRYALEGDDIIFSVSDNGPGLPDDFRPGISGHGSTGFGVIVAQTVAENHGGEFLLHNRPEGGAEALLRLPLAGGTPGRGEEEP